MSVKYISTKSFNKIRSFIFQLRGGRHLAPAISVSMGAGNGLSTDLRHQAISWSNFDLISH